MSFRQPSILSQISLIPNMAEEDTLTSQPETKNTKYVDAHGRRKEATARARLFKGKGQNFINGKALDNYFPTPVPQAKLKRPFEITKTVGGYYATIKVDGSGKSGQLDAVIHAISNALAKTSKEFRPLLKRAGLLTRDPRVKERRKYGLAQKARKGKQSPKR